MIAAQDWRSRPVPVIAGLGDKRRERGEPYRTRPLGDILAGTVPQSLPKMRALAFLPSLYSESDARSHTAQREHGRFVALVGDIDHGDYSLDLVASTVAAVAGDAAWSIYSTASAKPDDRRWRVVVPLSEPSSFDDWHDAQLALVAILQDRGLELDTSAARPGQISFLPNVPAELRGVDGQPLFFEQRSHSSATGFCIRSGHMADAIAAIRAKRAADDAERERIRAEAFERRARRPISSGDGVSMIDAFNRDNEVAVLLASYNYQQSPRHGEDWRSPMQTSESYATRVVEGDKWISLSGSDAASGLGERCSAGCFGDAFDLFCHFQHGGDRKAALRELHREREAMHQVEAYDPETGEFSDALKGGAEEVPEAANDPDGGLPLPTLDLVALAAVEPQNKAFAIARLAPLGEVTLFTGAGSAGKSLLGQQIATCSAAGLPVLGLDVMQTPAVYLTCEDDSDQLHWRQSKICGALGLRLADLAGKLHLSSLRGRLDNELTNFGSDGSLKPTQAFWRVSHMVRATAAKVVILDNVAHLFTGNENDRGEVTRFVNLLNRLAGETGAAVLLIGHPNKSGDSYSGSTAWLNAVRSQVFLAHDLETDVRTLTVGKANYAQKGEALRFLWMDGAFVREDDLPPDRAKELEGAIRATGDNEIFLKCLRERNRQQRAVSEAKGTNYAPNQFAQMPEAKGVTKQRLEAAMDRLFRINAIERGELPWKARERHTAIGLRETAANGAANGAAN